jgi:hypothetical protein
MQRHGTTDLVRRPNGTGTLSGGYKVLYVDGKRKQEHVVIAEKAIGRALAGGEVVHHVDMNGENNTPSNLVICPNDAYHALLHKRMRALDACGNANYERCGLCKQYDDPSNLENASTKGIMPYHKACKSEYNRNYHRNVRSKK